MLSSTQLLINFDLFQWSLLARQCGEKVCNNRTKLTVFSFVQRQLFELDTGHSDQTVTKPYKLVSYYF